MHSIHLLNIQFLIYTYMLHVFSSVPHDVSLNLAIKRWWVLVFAYNIVKCSWNLRVLSRTTPKVFGFGLLFTSCPPNCITCNSWFLFSIIQMEKCNIRFCLVWFEFLSIAVSTCIVKQGVKVTSFFQNSQNVYADRLLLCHQHR